MTNNSSKPDYLTASQAAEILGLSAERVGQFCRSGRLPAVWIGRQWLITRADVRKFAKKPRNPGRPRSKPSK